MKIPKVILPAFFVCSAYSFLGSVAPIHADAPNAFGVKVGDVARIRSHHPADETQFTPVAVNHGDLRTYELWNEAQYQIDLAAETKTDVSQYRQEVLVAKAPAEDLVKQSKIYLLPNNTKVRVLEIAQGDKLCCRVEVLSGDHKGFQGWTDDVAPPKMDVTDIVYLTKTSELADTDKDADVYRKAISNGDDAVTKGMSSLKSLFLVQAGTKCQIKSQRSADSQAALDRVHVLEGPMKGTEGWTPPDTLSLDVPSPAADLSPFPTPLSNREAVSVGDYAEVKLPNGVDFGSITNTDITVDFVVDEKGHPTKIKVVNSSGNAQLDFAFQKSIENTRFLPAIKDHYFVATRFSHMFSLGH